MDRIVISDLVCRCVIGVEEWERRERQDVLVSLELAVDLAPAGKSDRIEDALDYRALKKRVLAEAEASQLPPDRGAGRAHRRDLPRGRAGGRGAGTGREAGRAPLRAYRGGRDQPAPVSARAFIAVGSNLDAERNVAAALELLGRLRANRRRLHASTERPALGAPGSPDFLNGVVEIETELEPRELKRRVLLELENDARARARRRHERPRTIDLDLVLTATSSVARRGSCLPAPEIFERAFVALPLLELEPELVLPGTDQPAPRARRRAIVQRDGAGGVVQRSPAPGRSIWERRAREQGESARADPRAPDRDRRGPRARGPGADARTGRGLLRVPHLRLPRPTRRS